MGNIYRAVIIAHFSELPVLTANEIRQDEEIEFDYVEDKNINSSSTITSSPTVEGDYIADHMYRNPKTLSISGKFAESGYQPYLTNIEGRLEKLQDVFEEIQNKAVRCTIMTRRKNDISSVLFKVRDNMYLNNISWTEGATTLKFDFTFTEVMTITTDEIEYDENVVDDTLPALTEPEQTSAFSTIINMDDLSNLIDDTCGTLGLTSKEFMDGFQKAAIASAVGLAGGGLIVGSVALASNPVGWVIAGGIAVAFAYYGLYKAISSTLEARKYRLEQFRYYEDKDKMKAEMERYTGFKTELMKQLKALEKEMMMYSIASNKNQEMMLLIDNDYYDFEFIRNNDTGLYSLKVVNLTSNKIYTQSVISTITSITDCTSTNCVLETEVSGYFVYMTCPSLYGCNETNYKTIQKDLSKYKIAVLTFDPKDFNNMLVEIITNAVMK